MWFLDTFVLWLHLLAASVWVGGIIFLGIVLNPLMRKSILDERQRAHLIAQVGKRFNRFGWLALGVIGVTGVYNASRLAGGWESVPSLLAAQGFGQLILAKILLFLLMAAITFYHAQISGPRIRRMIDGSLIARDTNDLRGIEKDVRRLQSQSAGLMVILAILAILTLFVAAMLELSI